MLRTLHARAFFDEVPDGGVPLQVVFHQPSVLRDERAVKLNGDQEILAFGCLVLVLQPLLLLLVQQVARPIDTATNQPGHNQQHDKLANGKPPFGGSGGGGC